LNKGRFIYNSNIGELTTEYGRYTLLPQGKIFICFSRNTEKYVFKTQNELLLENLRSKQTVDWQPTAWNVAGHIDTFSKEGDAQSVIDDFASFADDIIFVVKDSIHEGLRHEWDLWTQPSKGKNIHLLIYDNKNAPSIHKELDPNKKIIYKTFRSYKDILIYILTDIGYELELNCNLNKLRFVRTDSEIEAVELSIRKRMQELLSNGAGHYIIAKFEKSIQTIETNRNEILNKTSLVFTEKTINMNTIYRQIPLKVEIPQIVDMSGLIPTSKNHVQHRAEQKVIMPKKIKKSPKGSKGL
jgi:hypothetical protein